MYAFEHHIRVQLAFRAMDAPVEISVPWNVLHYLDTHAEREVLPDGAVVYRRGEDVPLPRHPAFVPEMRALAVA
jgi:hypothetical protein